MSSSSKQKNFANAVAVQTKHRMLSIAQKTLSDSKSRCSSRASGAHGARGFGRVRRSRFVSSRSGRSVGSRLGDPVRPGGRFGADSLVSQWQSVATSGQSQTPGYDYEKVWYPAMPVRSMRLSPGTPDICKARISLILLMFIGYLLPADITGQVKAASFDHTEQEAGVVLRCSRWVLAVRAEHRIPCVQTTFGV